MAVLAQSSRVLPQFSKIYGQVYHIRTQLLIPISVQIMVNIAVMEPHDQNQQLEEGKDLFDLYTHQYHSPSGQELKQGRILKAETDADAMEGAAYWLARHDFSPCFLREARITNPVKHQL